MRKVSAHGLGQHLAPYPASDAPSSIPPPDRSVLGKGIERWHSDIWYQIIYAALCGNPNCVSLDFHPTLSRPAISRYGATTPELLKWFSTFNNGKPYRDQVKPFGFLLAMTAKKNRPFAEGNACGPSSKSSKRPNIRPIAPFDKSNAKAIRRAFDRIGGGPISGGALKTYAEALAQYHLQPESKFLNGDYWDQGTTCRRHVRTGRFVHIGKESNDWERQAILGLNNNSKIDYGTSPDDVTKELSSFLARYGEGLAVKVLGVSGSNLRKVIAGGQPAVSKALAAKLSKRLSTSETQAAKLQQSVREEYFLLSEMVARNGLRATGRELETDSSNLRRKIACLIDASLAAQNLELRETI